MLGMPPKLWQLTTHRSPTSTVQNIGKIVRTEDGAAYTVERALERHPHIPQAAPPLRRPADTHISREACLNYTYQEKYPNPERGRSRRFEKRTKDAKAAS